MQWKRGLIFFRKASSSEFKAFWSVSRGSSSDFRAFSSDFRASINYWKALGRISHVSRYLTNQGWSVALKAGNPTTAAQDWSPSASGASPSPGGHPEYWIQPTAWVLVQYCETAEMSGR